MAMVFWKYGEIDSNHNKEVCTEVTLLHKWNLQIKKRYQNERLANGKLTHKLHTNEVTSVSSYTY